MQALRAVKPIRKLSICSLYTTHKVLFQTTANLPKAKPVSDKPLNFLASKAKTYDSYDTFIDKNLRERPRSQPFIIILSLTVFGVYFFYIREENDFDELIYSPVAGLQAPNETYVNSKIQEYEKYGLDTSKIKSTVKEPTK